MTAGRYACAIEVLQRIQLKLQDCRFTVRIKTLLKAGKRVSVPLLTLAAVGYAVSVLVAHQSDFLASLRQVRLDKVTLAALAFLASTWLIALAWIKLIKGLESDVKPTVGLWRLHARSWLARYIPGKVIAPITRIQGGCRLGYSMGPLLQSVVYESLAQIPTAVLVGSVLVMLSGFQEGAIQWLLNVIVLASVVTLIVLTLSPSILMRLLPKRTRYDIPRRIIIRAVMLHIGANMLGGLGVTVLIPDLNSLPEAFYVMGAVNLSGVVAIALSITPAGIGIREGILTALLAPVLGAGAGLSVAILARALRIITDVIFGGLCYVLDRHGEGA